MSGLEGFFVAWAHGALTIASLWALVVWMVLLVSRPFAEDFKTWRDTYFWVSMANVLGCAGTFVISGMRSLDINVSNNMPDYSFPVVAVIGLTLLVTSRMTMVYASSLNNKPWRWRWFVIVLTIWTVFCGWWQLA